MKSSSLERAPLLPRVLHAGAAGAALSTVVAVVLGRIETGRATAAIAAVSHIVWGGEPPRDPGPGGVNLALGGLVHFGANLFWAAVFEQLFGRAARRSTSNAWLSGLAIAVMGYAVDYGLVPPRLRPGMETHLSRRSLALVYGALAAGYTWSALRTRSSAVADGEAERLDSLESRPVRRGADEAPGEPF